MNALPVINVGESILWQMNKCQSEFVSYVKVSGHTEMDSIKHLQSEFLFHIVKVSEYLEMDLIKHLQYTKTKTFS